MLDPRLYRENPEKIKQALQARRVQVDVDSLIRLDEEKRRLGSQLDQMKHARNLASDRIAQLKKTGEDATASIAETKTLGDKIKALQEEYGSAEKTFAELALLVPNIPHESVPLGGGSSDNKVVSEWGERRNFSFPLQDHMALGANLKLFDFERGAKITGRGFPVFTGIGARLERALIQFFLDTHIDKHGFTELIPPLLVNRQSMVGTSQLPKFEEDMYACGEDGLFLIPTAEVPVTNMHRDEIIPADKLPISYVAYTPCFRREAGSWGKDTRGFLRLHQFNKVEMVKFTEPEHSLEVLEELRAYGENLLRMLELPYRVLELCTGDLGFGAAKCYDLEVFAPAANAWLEVSSVSVFGDFQARRANIRTKKDGQMRFVHTLNGSGLATPRILVALLENFQTENGTVLIPEVLRHYLGGRKELVP